MPETCLESAKPNSRRGPPGSPHYLKLPVCRDLRPEGPNSPVEESRGLTYDGVDLGCHAGTILQFWTHSHRHPLQAKAVVLQLGACKVDKSFSWRYNAVHFRVDFPFGTSISSSHVCVNSLPLENVLQGPVRQ